MGKMTIVVVLGLAMIVMLVGNTINRANKAVIENVAGHEKRVLAREIAHSGVYKAIRALDRRDSTILETLTAGKTAFITEPIQGGVCSVWVNKTSSMDTLDLLASARYMDSAIVIRLKLKSGKWPEVGGCLVVSDKSNAELYTTNVATIHGDNVALDGSIDVGCDNVHGVTVAHYGDLTYNTSGTLVIDGAGGGPRDTAKAAEPIDYKPITDKLKLLATRVIPGGNYAQKDTFGTIAHPQITWCQAGYKNSAPITGAGILVVDSKFTANQTFDFAGMIFIVGDNDASNHDAELTNVNKFFGTIILTGPQVRLRTSNKPVLNYSCEALELAYGLISGGGTYSILAWYE